MGKNKKIAIVGAGLAGAALARFLAEEGDFTVDIFDSRNHVAGNCHTTRDCDSGVLVHQYGPHIFHTDSEAVWRFVNRFAEFNTYINRVKANTRRGIFGLPINLLTINQLFDKKFSPREAQKYISKLSVQFEEPPKNFEEQALAMVGKEIYETFFKEYTIKQWGVDPKELPAPILKRLPLRFTYEDNYFFHRFQGIPKDGYTAMTHRMLFHNNIRVKLNTFFPREEKNSYLHTFYSGPIDSFFEYRYGRLGYRSLEFDREPSDNETQGNAVINYCSSDEKFTRITEHNYFAIDEKHDKKVRFKEYSKLCESGDIPYYPLRLQRDKAILEKYQIEGAKLSDLSFIGRLGTYQYLDMDRVIEQSLRVGKEFIEKSTLQKTSSRHIDTPLNPDAAQENNKAS